MMIEQTIILNYGQYYEERIELTDNKPLEQFFTEKYIGQNVDENTWECALDDEECYQVYLWLTLVIGNGKIRDETYLEGVLELYDELVDIVRSGMLDTIELAYQSKEVED